MSARLNGSSGARCFERFRASALKRLPHRSFRPGESAIDRRLESRLLVLEEHARKVAQDYFDPAQLIHAAARSIHVLYADTDALNGGRELPELFSELPANVLFFVATEIHSHHADVSWNQRRSCAAGYRFESFG
jgi:hypothetical protein